MTAAELLDTLESRALLPGEVLSNLRQQVSRSIKIVTPESLAKLLVGKGLITAFQAEQLLAATKPAAKPATVDLDDEMSLAPLDDDKGSKSARVATPAPAKPVATAPAAPKPAAAKPVVATPVTAKPVASKPNATKPAVVQASQPAPAAKATAGAAAAQPKLAPKTKPSGSNVPAARTAPQADPLGLPATSGPLDDLLGSPLSDNSLLDNSLLDNSLLGDPLLGNPLGNPLLSEPVASAKANSLRPGSRRKKSIPTWVWFALSSVVGLALLAVAIFVLTRSNGDAEWQLAEKDYQAGQDQDATQKLNAFLEAFPQHRQASLARVYLGMARLRQAFAAKTDWDGQLTAARQVLPQLVTEPDFSQVRDTLAKMLPDMATGLAQQAQAFRGPLDQRNTKAEQARQGLALAEDWRFVPDKLKPWAALQTTSDEVTQLSREIDRGLDVDKSLTAVRAAIAAGNGADALAIRDKLLQSYPELRQGADIDPIIQELLHAAPQLVKVDSQSRPAETKPRVTPILATFTDVPLALQNISPAIGVAAPASAGEKPIGVPVANPKSPSIAVLASGAVYWLQASNGAPLGRQFVGLDSVRPVPIPPRANASGDKAGMESNSGATDSIVYDAVHRELVRFGDGGTELRWRQATGDAIDSAPVLLGRRLFVATRGGRLAMIDADSGKWISAAQFPEPLRAAPGVSADGKTLFVAGDHGTLYFVSAADLRCTAAADLGYGSGGVRLPPMAIGAYVVVVENPDWDGSALRVLSMPASDTVPRAVQRIALPGQVVSSPVVVGKQLIFATDKGIAMAFDASGSESLPLIKSMQTKPMQIHATRAQATQALAYTGSPQDWFVAVVGNQLWLAGNGLAHSDLGASIGATRLAADQLVGARSQQSPIVQGDGIVAVYRRSNGEGVWVRAINAASEPEWEAVLASPPIGEPMLDADGTALRLVHPPAGEVVSDSIGTPHVNRVAITQLNCPDRLNSDAKTDDASESLDPTYPACAGVALLPDGALAAAFDDCSTDAHASRLFFSIAKDPALRASLWSDSVCSPPVGLGKGLLIANSVGQLCLVDVATGQSLAAAFQPRLVPGERLAWRKPAVIGGKPEAIVADGGTHLYRLGVDEKPSAHLVALAEATVARPIVSDVAVAGELAFVADDAYNLTAVGVADLKPAKAWSLGGRIAWGPCRAGDVVYVATGGELLAIDKQPEIAWRVPLDSGVPIGLPLEAGDGLLLATADGIVERIDRKTGKLYAKVDLEQPLAAGPIVCGKNLAVVGQDGSIHIVPQP